ncbi:serine/threonine protein kinase [Nocardia sp. CDC159]|uniref:non-specific serine/threonine protein kinase n=1 Tax=Nocardia pulmonis TaxID=2951408 RepID=A0A9X2EBC8_9NOCA|nr:MULTISPECIES: serine/threonine-protein kinase [Nocardia]MCM6777794.1 serine/threonine protein kinase [Nocardia pulmonis]MCM6790679.1 serine/threonine protein kinase [Nocardia sp. CDC159]
MARWFGRYRLDGLIGRGSVGEVWRAHDERTGQAVALKILSVGAAEDPDYRRRFEREARVGAGLADPHIVPIHDFGEQDGRLYLAMAHVPGHDVAARLRGGPMGVSEAVDLISQIAEALDAAHAAGLVHRDVKPANIIVHPGGFAYLIDFGIARAADQTTITATGFTVGTLAYMAPERFAGHGDFRSDIYSLACVLYECLTARRPFGDTDPVQQLHAHLHQDPPRASATEPAVSAALDEVIARGMAKNADDRPQSAGALAAAARSAIGMSHPVSRTPPVLAASHASTPVLERQPSGESRSDAMASAFSPTRVLPMPPGPPAAASAPRAGSVPHPGAARVSTTPERPPIAAPPRTRAAVKIAALAGAAVVVFTAIAVVTALLTRDGRTPTTVPAAPSATVASATTPAPAPPPQQHTTAVAPPPLTIPVPPGFGTPPFQIPGISSRNDNSGPGNPNGHGNSGRGQDKDKEKDKQDE